MCSTPSRSVQHPPQGAFSIPLKEHAASPSRSMQFPPQGACSFHFFPLKECAVFPSHLRRKACAVSPSSAQGRHAAIALAASSREQRVRARPQLLSSRANQGAGCVRTPAPVTSGGDAGQGLGDGVLRGHQRRDSARNLDAQYPVRPRHAGSPALASDLHCFTASS